LSFIYSLILCEKPVDIFSHAISVEFLMLTVLMVAGMILPSPKPGKVQVLGVDIC